MVRRLRWPMVCRSAVLVAVTGCSAPEPATPASPAGAAAAAPAARSLTRCLGTEPDPPATTPPPTCRRFPERIQAVVRARMDGYRRCYEQVLAGDREATGRVVMTFTIVPDGAISRICASGHGAFASERFLDCMSDRMVTLRFDQEEACDGNTKVTYPFIFSPSE